MIEKISVDYQFFKWTKLELKNGNKVRLHPDSLSESDLELLNNEFKKKG